MSFTVVLFVGALVACTEPIAGASTHAIAAIATRQSHRSVGVRVATHAVTGHVYSFGVVDSFGRLAALQHMTPTRVTGIQGAVIEVAASNSNGYALTANGGGLGLGGRRSR